jgi:hypothetical protein
MLGLTPSPSPDTFATFATFASPAGTSAAFRPDFNPAFLTAPLSMSKMIILNGLQLIKRRWTMKQRFNRKVMQRLCIAAVLLITATDLYAGQITNVTWYSGVASVAGTVIMPPADINNDNVGGTSPNSFMVLQKDYTAIGPVDLVFDVLDSGGTVEYEFSEGVFNNTGLDWSGYHIELGFGTGAGFVKSGAGDGLDFDAPDYDSPVSFDGGGAFFPTVTVTEDDIIAGGGIMPDFAYAGNFIFHVDVPDGITEFTLRQSPIAVPEPASASLIALVAGGIWFGRRIFLI